jgi:hypothetical protein
MKEVPFLQKWFGSAQTSYKGSAIAGSFEFSQILI